MWVYIVIFEGAYGMQIDKVFTNLEKAVEYTKNKNETDYTYNYEMKKYFAE